MTPVFRSHAEEIEAVTQAPQPKFCKDCRWFKLSEFHKTKEDRASYAICRSPQNLVEQVNLVTGKQERVSKYDHCSTLRIGNSDCGQSAKWFEPRVAGMAEK